MDIPGVEEHDRITHLGKGVGIKVMNSSSISDPRLVCHFRDIARRESIPFQMEVLPRGGTDAGAMQRARGGMPIITLSIPMRYVHTPNEMVSEVDVHSDRPPRPLPGRSAHPQLRLLSIHIRLPRVDHVPSPVGEGG